MTSIHEAAERLRTKDTTVDAELDGEFQPTGMVRVSCFEWDDITDVRDEYLRLTDPTPLTTEVLSPLGFDFHDSEYRVGNKHSAIVFDCVNWWILDKHDMVIIRPKTVGSLRCIALGLGIELKD